MDLIKYFSVQNTEDSSTPAAQMVTAWLTSYHTHPGSFFQALIMQGQVC